MCIGASYCAYRNFIWKFGQHLLWTCRRIIKLCTYVYSDSDELFHVVTVSICGGIIHNMGQLIVAGFLVSSYYVIYYMPVLLIAGFVTGALIGIVAKEVGGRLCIHISKANYPK